MPVSLTENLTLPVLEEKYAGITLSFSSNNKAALSDDGTVTRSLEDVNVIFTVTATKGEESKAKEFTIKIARRAKNDAEKLEDVKAAFSLGNTENITANLTLITQDVESGATVSWATSDAGVITDTGVITRPAYGADAAAATLTATLTLGEASVTKTFDITVAPLGIDSLAAQCELTTATLSLVTEAPTLTLTGKAYLTGAAAVQRTVTLTIGSGATAIVIENDASLADNTDGAFSFISDLSALELPSNTWLDMKITVNESTVTKTTDIISTSDMLTQSVTGPNDATYEFKSYNSLLKLNKSTKPTIPASTDENVYFENDGHNVFLIVKGSMYFSEETALERTLTLTISHSKLTTITAANTSEDADTRKYLFKVNVSSGIPNGAYNEWLTMKFNFSETKEGVTRNYTGDVHPGTVTVGASNGYIALGANYYFVVQNSDYLKLVKTGDSTSVKASYLNTVDLLSLTQEDDKTYLNMKGTAFIGAEPAETERSIFLKVYNDATKPDMYANTDTTATNTTGAYVIKADITGKYGNLGNEKLYLVIIEGNKTVQWEVKQAAWDSADGGIVSKPAAGKTADLTACGVISEGARTSKLIVDEWNNIRLVVTIAVTLTDLTNKDDINIIEEGGRVYLVLAGSAYINDQAAQRTITLTVTNSAASGTVNETYENLSVDADKTKFSFKADITDLPDKGGDWYKFVINVSENGEAPVIKSFENGKFDTTLVTDKIITRIDSNGKIFRLKYEYNTVYMTVVNA